MSLDLLPEVFSKSEAAYRCVLTMICTEELRPGDRIDYNSLAEKLNMSTVPLSEAIRRLEAEGVVVRQPYSYTRVRTWSLRDSLEQLYVREALEGMAARLCARRITPDQVDTLRQAYEELRRLSSDPKNHHAMLEADKHFHELIAEYSETQLLIDLLRRTKLLPRTIGQGVLAMLRDCESHDEIFQAIASGDEDHAEYAVREHVRVSIDHCEKLLMHEESPESDGE